MKKAILPFVLALLCASWLLAVESEPSEVVGFIKIDAGVGFTYFSLPFTFYDASHNETLTLEDVVGNQGRSGSSLTGTKILQVGSALNAYRNNNVPPSTDLWTGTLTSFVDNKAYQIKVHSSHPTQTFYFAGTVQPEAQTIGTFPIGTSYAVVREAGVVSLSNCDLITSGFRGGNSLTSDKIMKKGTSLSAWYRTSDNTWQGTLSSIEPGGVYQIINKTQAGQPDAFTWVYDPLTRNTENSRVRSNASRR